MVFTLPEELGQDDEQALDAWTQATMDWIRDNAPGELAYAVMHRDEPRARARIHAMMPPHGRERHRQLQAALRQERPV